MKTELSKEECRAVYDTIDMLGGGNPEYVFAAFSSGEVDDPANPAVSAFAKIYSAAGRADQVPANVAVAFSEERGAKAEP